MNHKEAVTQLLEIAKDHPERTEDIERIIGHMASVLLTAEHAATVLGEAVDALPNANGIARSYASIVQSLEALGMPVRAPRS